VACEATRRQQHYLDTLFIFNAVANYQWRPPYSTRLRTYARLDARIKCDFRTHFPSSLTLDAINILSDVT
jgi:hypothetical protein